MPVPFPAIRPSNRTLTQPQYPVKRFSFISGNIATRKYGNQSNTEIVEFEFAHITDAQASLIGTAFDSAFGTYDTLILPNELWDDIDEPLRSLLKGCFSWRFRDEPVYSKSSIPGYKTVTVSIEGQRDSSTPLNACNLLIFGRGPICSSPIRYDIKWEQMESQVFSDFTDETLNSPGPISVVQAGFSRSSSWRQMSAQDVQTWLFVQQVENVFTKTTAGGWWNPIYDALSILSTPLGISAYHCDNPPMIFAYGGLNYFASFGGRFTYTSPFATANDRINLGVPFSNSFTMDVEDLLTNTTSDYTAAGGFTQKIGFYDYNLWLNKGGTIYVPEVSGSGPGFYTGTVTTYAHVRNFMIKRHGVDEPYQLSSSGIPVNSESIDRVFVKIG